MSEGLEQDQCFYFMHPGFNRVSDLLLHVAQKTRTTSLAQTHKILLWIPVQYHIYLVLYTIFVANSINKNKNYNYYIMLT